MALLARVTARYSAEFVLNLSNPDSAAATSNDTTRLGLLVEDAEAEFELFAGVEYDDDDALHRSFAVEAVIVLAQERGGRNVEEARASRKEWERKMEELRTRVGCEDRIEPATTVESYPSDEQTGVNTLRPEFDIPAFNDSVPTRRTRNEDEPGS